jgi:hypothetical protein
MHPFLLLLLSSLLALSLSEPSPKLYSTDANVNVVTGNEGNGTLLVDDIDVKKALDLFAKMQQRAVGLRANMSTIRAANEQLRTGNAAKDVRVIGVYVVIVVVVVVVKLVCQFRCFDVLGGVCPCCCICWIDMTTRPTPRTTRPHRTHRLES